MPRKLRVEYEGAPYHLMNRGDRREPIFKGYASRQRFRQCLEWGAQPPRLHRSAPRRPDRVFGEGAEHCTRGGCAPQAKQAPLRKGASQTLPLVLLITLV